MDIGKRHGRSLGEVLADRKAGIPLSPAESAAFAAAAESLKRSLAAAPIGTKLGMMLSGGVGTTKTVNDAMFGGVTAAMHAATARAFVTGFPKVAMPTLPTWEPPRIDFEMLAASRPATGGDVRRLERRIADLEAVVQEIAEGNPEERRRIAETHLRMEQVHDYFVPDAEPS